MPIKSIDNCQILEIHHVEGRNIPLQPWPQRFWLSAQSMDSPSFEVRPMTATAMVKAISQNFVSMSWWRFRWLFFRIGFLDCPPGERLSFRHQWRWDFWNVRAAR